MGRRRPCVNVSLAGVSRACVGRRLRRSPRSGPSLRHSAYVPPARTSPAPPRWQSAPTPPVRTSSAQPWRPRANAPLTDLCVSHAWVHPVADVQHVDAPRRGVQRYGVLASPALVTTPHCRPEEGDSVRANRRAGVSLMMATSSSSPCSKRSAARRGQKDDECEPSRQKSSREKNKPVGEGGPPPGRRSRRGSGPGTSKARRVADVPRADDPPYGASPAQVSPALMPPQPASPATASDAPTPPAWTSPAPPPRPSCGRSSAGVPLPRPSPCGRMACRRPPGGGCA